jgi:hypothetical protein
MHTFPYVCPHCGASQFIAYHKGYSLEVGYKELAVPGLPETDRVKEPCIGSNLRASVCSRCLEPSIEIEVVLKKKNEEIDALKRDYGLGAWVRLPHT